MRKLAITIAAIAMVGCGAARHEHFEPPTPPCHIDRDHRCPNQATNAAKQYQVANRIR